MSHQATSTGAGSIHTPVTQFGATGDGRKLNTASIQAAIDSVFAAGGGVVSIPGGVFLSGAIFLKPGVNLHLDRDAVLKGSTDICDYPKRNTRIEGHFENWLPALVNAEGVDHLRIAGTGTLDGSGAPFWAAFWRRRRENPDCTNLEVERPRLLFIENCQDVTITGLTLKDSGFWNLHLYRCREVTIDRLDIHGQLELKPPSTDGIDIDSSQRVTVSNCRIAVNDDCIALKGTRGPLALDDAQSPPVEHVRITDCTFIEGHAALTCGSEATVVGDVVMERCQVLGDMPLLHLKLRPDTPQSYHDILIRDVKLQNGSIFDVSPWTQFFDLQGQPAPRSAVRKVTLSGITGSFASLGWIEGNPGTSISDITLKDFNVQLRNDQFKHGKIDGLHFDNVVVNGSKYAPREL